jgi:hypothetical protein
MFRPYDRLQGDNLNKIVRTIEIRVALDGNPSICLVCNVSCNKFDVICSVITQWSESRRTRKHTYCLIWDSPNLEGQVPVFISPRNRVAQLYPSALGLGGTSRSYFTTDGQSASQYVLVLSPLVGLATRNYVVSECFSLKIAVLSLWDALSDERSSLSLSSHCQQ